MLVAISHFLLSECLWSITNGGYHTPINIFVMIGLCVFILRQRTVPAVLLSVSANLVSFFVFIGIIYFAKIEYVPDHDTVYVVSNVLQSCMFLAAIYAVLQSTFFFALRWAFKFDLGAMVVIACVSNVITGWIMYRVLSV